MFSLPRALVQFLVSELRPHKLCNVAKKKERKKEMSFYCCEALRFEGSVCCGTNTKLILPQGRVN